MKNEYIIINKTLIQKKIEELEEKIAFYNKVGALHLNPNKVKAETEISLLKQILSQSTPLIPVVGNAWDASLAFNHPAGFDSGINKQDYIANLKLDI